MTKQTTAAQNTPPVSDRARKALRTLAKVSTELTRPINRGEWQEGLGSLLLGKIAIRNNHQAIEELLAGGLVEEWRGAYRASREALPLLRRGGMDGIDPHDRWAICEDGSPMRGQGTEQITGLDELLPLGFGDVLVRVIDDRYALADARLGDVLVFRHAQVVNPGDLYLEVGQGAVPTGLSAAGAPGIGKWVLVTLIRKVLAG